MIMKEGVEFEYALVSLMATIRCDTCTEIKVNSCAKAMVRPNRSAAAHPAYIQHSGSLHLGIQIRLTRTNLSEDNA